VFAREMLDRPNSHGSGHEILLSWGRLQRNGNTTTRLWPNSRRRSGLVRISTTGLSEKSGNGCRIGTEPFWRWGTRVAQQGAKRSAGPT